MKYLVTNDDGIEAHGLQALFRGLPADADRQIIAPDKVMSECSHRVTTKTPLIVNDHSLGHAVTGTPADCTRLALLHLAKDVDVVVSGVNEGANLGVDVHLSGTVAAAREATIMGKPAIAFSQYRLDLREADWTNTAALVARCLARLDQEELPDKHFWNINFPDPMTYSGEPELVFCEVDPSPLPVAYEVDGQQFRYGARYAQRDREPGKDVDVCFSGAISISLLHV